MLFLALKEFIDLKEETDRQTTFSSACCHGQEQKYMQGAVWAESSQSWSNHERDA